MKLDRYRPPVIAVTELSTELSGDYVAESRNAAAYPQGFSALKIVDLRHRRVISRPAVSTGSAADVRVNDMVLSGRALAWSKGHATMLDSGSKIVPKSLALSPGRRIYWLDGNTPRMFQLS